LIQPSMLLTGIEDSSIRADSTLDENFKFVFKFMGSWAAILKILDKHDWIWVSESSVEWLSQTVI